MTVLVHSAPFLQRLPFSPIKYKMGSRNISKRSVSTTKTAKCSKFSPSLDPVSKNNLSFAVDERRYFRDRNCFTLFVWAEENTPVKEIAQFPSV